MASAKISIPSENAKGPIPTVKFGDPKTSPIGIVVIQEWWGMNKQIQEAALDFSKRGNFTTIVPDLYRGEIAIDREHAGHLMTGLDWKGAVLDIQGCVKQLLKDGCSKVGVIGFCMGGALSLAAAALVPEVEAAAPFYGIPSSELCDVSKIKIPVQCHYADLDEIAGFSSPADQEILKQKLTSGGVDFKFYSYAANHAFANSVSPNYNQEAAETALGRAVEFFQKNLA